MFTLKKGGLIISLHPNSEVRTEKTLLSKLNRYRNVVKSSGSNMMEIAKLPEQKTVIPHVSFSFPLEQMAAAHLQIKTGRTKGKLVVTL